MEPKTLLITPLNRLPVVVTGPGIYIRRDGKRVEVHTVKPNDDLSVTAFTVNGATERMFRGAMRFKGFNIWHVSGRAYGLAEHPSDIIRKEG